ncbi:3-hydroxyisobutyrate dehydrogenase-like beta-hydroxyacid dehydrogenase [Arthrobacter sp. B3I9]|uniref:NAD(P)-dependent oxidoreductase n=1 Tax=Arthrobacter sp. B3I9 TaxID=3042270 RepID=UPI00278D7575|nr:NAD(P)-dependent oxidoreductase [Arthrobacter sp. B3I9]MDQ0848854.1 3-hydroxyisobutyrate dehydrogenase-like beta-hydroxyacid dehydrogenase [Arthrobacter sp. B3I9]
MSISENQTLPGFAGSVALLGTGPMGAPIARNILAGGVPLTLWNRTPEKAHAVGGGTVAAAPAGAASDVVLTVLPDLPQVAALLPGENGLLAGWKSAGIDHPILVIHGTVSPVAVAEFAEDCRRRWGLTVLDAPLSGGTIGAEERRLSIMVGGPSNAVEHVRPLFELYGSTVVWFGETGAGSTVKACNQIVVAATVTALAEAMALASTAGLDLEKVQSVLAGGLAKSEVLTQKGRRWMDQDFEGGGSAKNQLKDLRFITDLARHTGLKLPVATCLQSAFEDMIAAGDGDLDHTGIYRTILEQSTKPAPR